MHTYTHVLYVNTCFDAGPHPVWRSSFLYDLLAKDCNCTLLIDTLPPNCLVCTYSTSAHIALGLNNYTYIY